MQQRPEARNGRKGHIQVLNAVVESFIMPTSQQHMQHPIATGPLNGGLKPTRAMEYILKLSNQLQRTPLCGHLRNKCNLTVLQIVPRGLRPAMAEKST